MGTCSGTGGGECGSGGKDVRKDERRVDMKGYVLLSPVLLTVATFDFINRLSRK